MHHERLVDFPPDFLWGAASAAYQVEGGWDADGVDLLGFCPWSFTDILSWLNGYQKRYGFVYVDRDETDLRTLQRIPKKSFGWYRSVISSNGAAIGRAQSV